MSKERPRQRQSVPMLIQRIGSKLGPELDFDATSVTFRPRAASAPAAGCIREANADTFVDCDTGRDHDLKPGRGCLRKEEQSGL